MNPISVSIGSSHTFVVDSNGKLWGLGSNTEGQLGIPDEIEVHKPQNLHAGKIRQVSCGSHHTTLIDAEDKFWCFGNGGDGRLGNNSVENQHTPFQHNIENARNTSAGWRHSAVIDNLGVLRMFGCNCNGQLGMGDTVTRSTPSIVMEIDKAYQVSCGGKHTAVVDMYGNLWMFGDNFQGQLGQPDWEVHRKPVWVSHISRCRFTSAGWEHTAAIDTNNNLWMFGSNDHGQLGIGDEAVNNPSLSTPTVVLTNVKTVSAGGTHTIAITFDGSVYACGSNFEGQCGLPEAKIYRTFTKVESLPQSDTVTCNQSSLVVDSTGKVWGFGANCSGEIGPHLSDFNKKGSVVLRSPEIIESLQLYLRHTMVKSSRSVCMR